MRGEIKTEEGLLSRLEKAARVPLDRQQIEEQRVSFIYGNLRHKSTLTHAQIRTSLDKIKGGSESI